jgi:16S rRNA C1402 (ribose-2'-O) methylase RsmI
LTGWLNERTVRVEWVVVVGERIKKRNDNKLKSFPSDVKQNKRKTKLKMSARVLHELRHKLLANENHSNRE